MEIVLGKNEEVQQYHALTKRCADNMIARGIHQWNSQYPSFEILKNDVALKQLWKFSSKEKLIGIIVLTANIDEEYKAVKWLTTNEKNLYVHRLAIQPHLQGQGYAQKLMDFAEKYAQLNNYQSIRLDTFSQNKRNQRFYEKRNYTKLGPVFFPNQSDFPFFCYEKIVNV